MDYLYVLLQAYGAAMIGKKSISRGRSIIGYQREIGWDFRGQKENLPQRMPINIKSPIEGMINTDLGSLYISY